MLNTWLEFHRATLIWKCTGLTDEQLRLRSVPPSSLSLLGLVRHMTEVERAWFQRVFLGTDSPHIYSAEPGQDGDFDDVDTADVASDLARFAEECQNARIAEASAESLDVTGVNRRDGELVSLRWILVHMIEEYARHNGHADLIRECIDGATGD
jgi:uncharacterized damage-inducible protein DinB